MTCAQTVCLGCPDAVRDFAAEALERTYQVACEFGQVWTFRTAQESDVNRDPYRAVKSTVVPDSRNLSIPVFPVIHRPNDDQITRSGFKGSVDVILTTPYLAWAMHGIDRKMVDQLRWQAVGWGQAFRVLDFVMEHQIGGVFINWTFSLVAGD